MIPKNINQIQEMIVSDYFENIDMNNYVINGNVVHLTFRGQAKSEIPDNVIILSGIPRNAVEDVYLFISSTDRYPGVGGEIRWGYFSETTLKISGTTSAGKWVHISCTYIKA